MVKSPVKPVDPSACTCLALSQATRCVQRLYDGALAPHGLSIGQFSFLAHLAAFEALTAADLAERCAMDASTVSRLTRPLIARGLIRAERDPEDRRALRLSLSAKGRETFDAARAGWREAQGTLDAAIGRKASAVLRAEMRRLVAAL